MTGIAIALDWVVEQSQSARFGIAQAGLAGQVKVIFGVVLVEALVFQLILL